MTDYDYKLFEETKDYATSLERDHSQRMLDAEKYRKTYMLEWDDAGKLEANAEHIKTTVHPLPRNAAQGAKRLLTATEATFSVPNTIGKEDINNVSSRVERTANAIWWKSGLVNGAPLEEDAALSLILYDQVDLIINKVDDLIEPAMEGAHKRRLERVKESTPYLIQVKNPEGSYPDFDALGLRAYMYKSKVQSSYIVNMFGDAGLKAVNSAGENYGWYDDLTLVTMYDLDYMHIWLDEASSEPLYAKEHNLPFIPVVSELGEGNRSLFNMPADQRQPFLYTLLKAKLWDRLNLLLSYMYTNVATNMGIQYIYKGAPGNAPQFHTEPLYGYIQVNQDEDLRPTADKSTVDKSVWETFQAASELGTESTIFRQALGEPLGKGEAFSTIALLHQAGRLPLVTIQRQLSNAMAEAIMIAFEWMKHDKGEYKMRYKNNLVEITADELPDPVIINAKLEIDLPQDQLQMANIINILDGKVPRRYWIENILNEQQPETLMQEASSEKMWDAMVQGEVQEILARAQLKIQQQQMEMAQQQQMIAQQNQMMQQAQAQAMGQGSPAAPPGIGTPPGGPGANPFSGAPEMSAELTPEQRAAIARSQGGVIPTPQVPPTPQPRERPLPEEQEEQ